MVEQSTWTWSEEDRQQIAKTILAYIRAGSTQIEAFKRLSEMYPTRTPAAIGFLWNNQLRPLYQNQIAEAKLEGKEAKRRQLQVDLPEDDEELTAQPSEDVSVESESHQEYVDFIGPDIALNLVSNVLVQLEEMNLQMSRAIRYLKREVDQVKTRF